MDEDLKEILQFIAGILFLLFIVIFVLSMVYFYSSCREAKIFNNKYETSYTGGDFFWAQDQINQQIQTIKLEGLK